MKKPACRGLAKACTCAYSVVSSIVLFILTPNTEIDLGQHLFETQVSTFWGQILSFSLSPCPFLRQGVTMKSWPTSYELFIPHWLQTWALPDSAFLSTGITGVFHCACQSFSPSSVTWLVGSHEASILPLFQFVEVLCHTLSHILTLVLILMWGSKAQWLFPIEQLPKLHGYAGGS